MASNFNINKKNLPNFKSVLGWVLFVFGIMVITYDQYTNAKMYPVAPVSFMAFDTSELSGRLKYIAHMPSKKSYFSINNDSSKYYRVNLIEYNAKYDNNFNAIAVCGDSIAKKKHSNILILFKNSQIHYYYIPKPQE